MIETILLAGAVAGDPDTSMLEQKTQDPIITESAVKAKVKLHTTDKTLLIEPSYAYSPNKYMTISGFVRIRENKGNGSYFGKNFVFFNSPNILEGMDEKLILRQKNAVVHNNSLYSSDLHGFNIMYKNKNLQVDLSALPFAFDKKGFKENYVSFDLNVDYKMPKGFYLWGYAVLVSDKGKLGVPDAEIEVGKEFKIKGVGKFRIGYNGYYGKNSYKHEGFHNRVMITLVELYKKSGN